MISCVRILFLIIINILTITYSYSIESIASLRLSAEHGNAEAQNNLGVMYDDGQGVPQNYTEAVKWYKLAAQQGNAKALEVMNKINQ